MRKVNLVILSSILFVLFSGIINNPVFASEKFYDSINDCTEKILSSPKWNPYPEWNRIKCFAYFASQENDINVCLDKYKDEKCFWAYAAWKKDASICRSINQYLALNEINQKNCYFGAALASRDSNLCEATDNECRKAVGKIKSYYIYLPILFALFLFSLIYLFIFKKNTKTRLIIAMLIALIPPALIVPIRNCLDFLKNFDFHFQNYKFGQLYLDFVNNFYDLGEVIFIYLFILLVLIYLPIVALVKSYQSYKIGDNKWWQFLIIFFAIHLFGIIVVVFATLFGGLSLALLISGISSLIFLPIFFISISKIKQQI